MLWPIVVFLAASCLRWFSRRVAWCGLSRSVQYFGFLLRQYDSFFGFLMSVPSFADDLNVFGFGSNLLRLHWCCSLSWLYLYFLFLLFCSANCIFQDCLVFKALLVYSTDGFWFLLRHSCIYHVFDSWFISNLSLSASVLIFVTFGRWNSPW